MTSAAAPSPSDTADSPPADADPSPETPPAAYVEAKYLRAFADVAEAVRTGGIPSGLEHYRRYGVLEGRLDRLNYLHAAPVAETENFPAHGLDAVFWSPSGFAMVIGWTADHASPLDSLSLIRHDTTLGVTASLARCRRQDAEQAVGAVEGRHLGYWSVFPCRTDVKPSEIRLLLLAGDDRKFLPASVQLVGDERLRDISLEFLASASYWSNPQVEAFFQLDSGIGDTLISAGAGLAMRIAGGAVCRRFGPDRNFVASIVVCLYGKPEYLFLQAALFSATAHASLHEFIYVSNSPELTELLCKEAENASRIYGLSITLVLLPGNAGFGVANNVAVMHARSDRVLIVNPDVFPRSPDWATRHAALLDGLPDDQTRLFGVPLFYDDGSLMHGGMYFDLDEGYACRPGRIVSRALARVEHYGKGAPPGAARYRGSAMVPAASGAMLSVDRAWFERLGGFSASYLFGHYEDADLCLRSLEAGTPVWRHDLAFWHLEGKGSIRRHVHEGGSLLNRWHFTRQWEGALRDGMLGPDPARLAQPRGTGA